MFLHYDYLSFVVLDSLVKVFPHVTEDPHTLTENACSIIER